MIRALFILEQHLGHRTYAENLRYGFAQQSQIAVQWSAVTYYEPDGWLERLPLPAGIRGHGEVDSRYGEHYDLLPMT